MKIWFIVIFVVVIFVVIGVLVCLLILVSDDKGFVVGDGFWLKFLVDKWEFVVVFIGIDLNGKKISIVDVKGKVIVVNVWGLWCVLCCYEVFVLVKVVDSIKNVVVFYGINMCDFDFGLL